MAKIEFLGGEETGDVGRLKWGRYTFEINKEVECNDPHIVKKAMGNRFFKVDGEAPKEEPKPDPMTRAKVIASDLESSSRSARMAVRSSKDEAKPDRMAAARAAKAAKREAPADSAEAA